MKTLKGGRRTACPSMTKRGMSQGRACPEWSRCRKIGIVSSGMKKKTTEADHASPTTEAGEGRGGGMIVSQVLSRFSSGTWTA